MITTTRTTSSKARSLVMSAIILTACSLVITACQNQPSETLSNESSVVQVPGTETPGAGEPGGSNSSEVALEPLPENARQVTMEEIKARGPRIFCVPQLPGTVNTLGRVVNTEWVIESVALNAPCENQLRLRHQNGKTEDVPLAPGAYYFGMGQQIGEQTVLLLTHIAHGDFLPEGNGRLYTNVVDPTAITITRTEEGWSGVSTVVDRDEAIWAVRITSDLRMMYLQDSLFEHMLFIQEGRPASDGLYEAQLKLLPSGQMIATDSQRIDDYRYGAGSKK